MAANKATQLVKDLVRLGDYSKWLTPRQPENIKWFSDKGRSVEFSHQNEDLLCQRLEELVEIGADLKNLTSIIANVNRPKLLQKAFELGADPNALAKSGQHPLHRAISRKRTEIAQVFLDHPNLDKNYKNPDGKNILLMLMSQSNYVLVNSLIKSMPNLIYEKDNEENTVLHLLGQSIQSNGNKANYNMMRFLKTLLEMEEIKQSGILSVSLSNKKGQSFLSLAPEVAQIIVEKQAIELDNYLEKKDPIKKKLNKI